MKKINFMSPSLKDGVVFLAWTGGILLIAGLCWFLTGSIRNEFLLRSVNRVIFSGQEDQRFWLEKPLPSREIPHNASRMGSWFSVSGNTGSRALIFTLFAQGNFLPCMALVNSNGKVEKILPLSVHAETMLNRLPGGAVGIYIRRIEEAVK
ncbi:MAG: hypothetical protein LBH43_00160 [Treponema sp.]|jgi:hypothetical protein|nr:hypothetical protein [Treponema sp.]